MQIYMVEIIIIFVLGLAVGGFLNVIEYRINKKLSIGGRSICPHCRHVLRLVDVLPIASFLILGGQCRYCHKKISWQYPLVEFMIAILFLLFYIKYSMTLGLADPYLWRDLIALSFLVLIFIYDFKNYLILDSISIPAIFIILVINSLLGYPLDSMFYGVLIGGGFFLLQYIISGGRWIGGGDIRLGIIMGVLLGWQLVIIALFISYLIGAVFGLGAILIKGRKASHQVPFGTYLTVGTVITMLLGEIILNWYLSFM